MRAGMIVWAKRILFGGVAILLWSCEKSHQDEEARELETVTKKKRERSLPASPDPVVREIQGEVQKAKQEEDPEIRDRRLAAIAWSHAGLRPEMVEAAVLEMSPDSLERQPLIQLLAVRYCEEDPEEALRWINRIGDEDGKRIAREQIAMNLVESDPQRALGELSRVRIPVETTHQATDYVLKRWVTSEPKQALDWLKGSYSIDNKEERIPQAIGHWLETDPEAAIRWVDQSLGQNLRTAAVTAASEYLMRQPPELRNPIVENLDPRVREELGVEMVPLDEVPEETDPAE